MPNFLKRLRNTIRRKPKPTIPARAPTPTHRFSGFSWAGEQAEDDLVSVAETLEDGERFIQPEIFDHGQPPPAVRWSAPPYPQLPTNAPAPLYRDDCIRLHREVGQLRNENDELANRIEELEGERGQFVVELQQFQREGELEAITLAKLNEQVEQRDVVIQQLRIEIRKLQEEVVEIRQSERGRIWRAQVIAADGRATRAEEALRMLKAELWRTQGIRRELEEWVVRMEGNLLSYRWSTDGPAVGVAM